MSKNNPSGYRTQKAVNIGNRIRNLIKLANRVGEDRNELTESLASPEPHRRFVAHLVAEVASIIRAINQITVSYDADGGQSAYAADIYRLCNQFFDYLDVIFHIAPFSFFNLHTDIQQALPQNQADTEQLAYRLHEHRERIRQLQSHHSVDHKHVETLEQSIAPAQRRYEELREPVLALQRRYNKVMARCFEKHLKRVKSENWYQRNIQVMGESHILKSVLMCLQGYQNLFQLSDGLITLHPTQPDAAEKMEKRRLARSKPQWQFFHLHVWTLVRQCASMTSMTTSLNKFLSAARVYIEVFFSMGKYLEEDHSYRRVDALIKPDHELLDEMLTLAQRRLENPSLTSNQRFKLIITQARWWLEFHEAFDKAGYRHKTTEWRALIKQNFLTYIDQNMQRFEKMTTVEGTPTTDIYHQALRLLEMLDDEIMQDHPSVPTRITYVTRAAVEHIDALIADGKTLPGMTALETMRAQLKLLNLVPNLRCHIWHMQAYERIRKAAGQLVSAKALINDYHLERDDKRLILGGSDQYINADYFRFQVNKLLKQTVNSVKYACFGGGKRTTLLLAGQKVTLRLPTHAAKIAAYVNEGETKSTAEMAAQILDIMKDIFDHRKPHARTKKTQKIYRDLIRLAGQKERAVTASRGSTMSRSSASLPSRGSMVFNPAHGLRDAGAGCAIECKVMRG